MEIGGVALGLERPAHADVGMNALGRRLPAAARNGAFKPQHARAPANHGRDGRGGAVLVRLIHSQDVRRFAGDQFTQGSGLKNTDMAPPAEQPLRDFVLLAHTQCDE